MDGRYFVTLEAEFITTAICLYELIAGELIPLDIYRKLTPNRYPRTDKSGHIYVPHSGGVAVFRIVENRLHMDRNLRWGYRGWLRYVNGVAVVNDTTLCVTTGWSEEIRGVYLVDIMTNTVLNALHLPSYESGLFPSGVGVLGGRKLVAYNYYRDFTLALYSPGELDGVQLHIPGLRAMGGMAVDPAGRFLVADVESNTVWVLSVTGKVLARVQSDEPIDITLSSDNSKLYIGHYQSGEITVLEGML